MSKRGSYKIRKFINKAVITYYLLTFIMFLLLLAIMIIAALGIKSNPALVLTICVFSVLQLSGAISSLIAFVSRIKRNAGPAPALSVGDSPDKIKEYDLE
jgi:hypothetical protein